MYRTEHIQHKFIIQGTKMKLITVQDHYDGDYGWDSYYYDRFVWVPDIYEGEDYIDHGAEELSKRFRTKELAMEWKEIILQEISSELNHE